MQTSGIGFASNPWLGALRSSTAPCSAGEPSTVAETVELSGGKPSPAPSARLWAEAEAAGLLAGSAVQGPLGPVLTSTMRSGLGQVLQELEQRGASFSVPHKRLLRSEEQVPTGPAATLEHLEEHGFSGVQCRLPGSVQTTYLRGLKEIRALEFTLCDPQAPVMEALDSLKQAGLLSDPVQYYRSLMADGYVNVTRRIPNGYGGDPDFESYRAGSPDQVLALDYFLGSKTDRGLADASRARHLAGLVEANLLSAWDAYDAYAEPKERVALGDNDRIHRLSVPWADLGDPSQVRDTYDRFKAAYARYVMPALGAMGHVGRSVSVPDVILQSDGPQTLESRLASYGTFLQAAVGSGREAYGEAWKLYNLALANSATPLELGQKTEMLAAVYKDQGLEAALKAADEVARAPQPGRDAKAELFEALQAATGSFQAATQGVGLVRIPVGGEDASLRRGLFERIAAQLPETQREQTPTLYQEVLINRHPDESLQVAGGRFLSVLSGCAALGYPLLAPALFEVLQDGYKNGSIKPDQLDARVQEFLSQALVNPSLGEALSRLESVTARGSIQVQGDQVVVGGVRLKTRRAG